MKALAGFKRLFTRLVFVIPVAIALLIAATMAKSVKGPEYKDSQETARTVRVITAQAVDVVPRVVGYGYVEPGQVWQAVAEVSGKVIELHKFLKKGSFMKKGEVLMKIDPARYDLAVAQKEANIESVKAQLAELEINEKNLKASLGIEQKNLNLHKKELTRQQELLEKKMVARSAYEKQEQAYYAQLGKVQNIKNSLNLIPANRKTLNANLKVNRIALEDAKLDRQNTTVKAPFDCRLTAVNTEITQFVQRGQVVVSADGIKTAEIHAQIPTGKMRSLAQTWEQDFSLAQVEPQKFTENFPLNARIRYNIGGYASEWDARFAGIDALLDSQARTLGVIVVVDDPYRKIDVGVRPPLVRNMFCEVELSGNALPGKVVIPRSALHDGAVYVMNAEKRLEKKPVTTAFSQTNFYVLEEGLKTGEMLIVSDLIPAIEGMLLKPVTDEALAATLIAEATGEGDIK